MEKKGLFTRIRERLFQRKETEPQAELVIEEPTQSQETEIVQGIDRIELAEQLQIIRAVHQYMDEFVLPSRKLDPALTKGFALQNQVFVTTGEETVYRTNMDVFFQEKATGERKVEYLVSLVRFEDDEWRVFQVKEVLPAISESN